MNKDRKILLLILFFSVLVAFSFMNILTLSDKRKKLKSNILSSEMMYSRIGRDHKEILPEDVEEFRKNIEEEKKAFFVSEDTDPYKFGLEIKDLLEKSKLNVISYKTIEEEDSYLIEFSIKGSTYNFFSFLNNLNRSGMNYRFPYLTIRNEKRGLSSVFRIGYSLYE